MAQQELKRLTIAQYAQILIEEIATHGPIAYESASVRGPKSIQHVIGLTPRAVIVGMSFNGYDPLEFHIPYGGYTWKRLMWFCDPLKPYRKTERMAEDIPEALPDDEEELDAAS